VAQPAITGAFGEGQLGDESGLHPGDVAGARRVDEGRLFARQR
jgi:hypothetical protein